MKHTLLIALLGATVTLATPSLSFADNGQQYKNGSIDKNYKHKHQRSNANRERRHNRSENKRFVPKVPKPHNVVKRIKRDLNKNRHHNRQIVKHNNGHNKHYNQRNNNSSFSISWNVGGPTIAYGNNNYGHNNGYKVYNKGQRQNHGKRIYKRIHNQANRIQNGVHNGQLVNREVRKLRREQRHIKQTLSHYKRDGRLNRHESSQMNQLLNVASNNINRKMNNRLTRFSKHNNTYVQY